MAIVKTSHSPLESYIAFAEESAFGTAIADDQVFTILDTVSQDTPPFVPADFVDEDPRNNGTNISDVGDYFRTTNGLWQRYTLPEIIAPSDVLAHLWYAVAQGVSEAVGAPYVKTYTLNGTGDPDFSANAGYFFTLLIKNAIASQSQKLTSCIAESITVTFDQEQGGRARVSGTFLTGQGFSETSNPSGANAYSTVTVPSFHNATHTLTIGGIDVVPYSVSYTFTNTVAEVGYASGNFDNYKILHQGLTCSAMVKWDSNSDGLRALRGGSTGQDFAHTIGSSGAAGYWNVAGTGVAQIMTADIDSSSEDAIQKLNLGITLKGDSANTNYPAVAIADGVDQAW